MFTDLNNLHGIGTPGIANRLTYGQQNQIAIPHRASAQQFFFGLQQKLVTIIGWICLLYTSDAADE